MKILTIAIPTYNRAKDLDKLLYSIFNQKFPNEIEFIISDNNSIDDTDKVVKKYIESGFNINYIKNRKNIGPDNNFIQCFNLTKTKYFWLIGDDDVLLEGSLEIILKILKLKESFGVVFLNSYPFLKDYLKEMPKKRKNGFIIYQSIEDFLKKVNYFITFISTSIINKELALKNIDIESMKDTNLIQLSWTLNALFNSKKNVFVNDYCVAAKSGANGGYKLSQVFAYNLNKIFELYIQKGVEPIYFEIIKKRMLVTFWPANIIRSKNQLFKGEPENFFNSLYPIYKNYLYFWIFTLPAIILPNNVSFLIYLFVNYLRKIIKF